MKNVLKYFYLFLFVVFPLFTYADLSGTFIFRHPGNDFNELWMANLANPQDAQLIYKHTDPIYEFATEKKGAYIAIVADVVEPVFGADIYLFNGKKPNEIARNLTHGLFRGTWDIDISDKGGIIFTTIQVAANGRLPGVYLIPKDELDKKEPNIELLFEDDVNSIVWAPNGEQIAFHNIDGIFSLDVVSQKVSLIRREARYPAYSPDGTKLAYINRPLFEPQDLRIISLPNLEEEQVIKLEDRTGLRNLKWTLNGEYVVYSTNSNRYAVPIDGGVQVKLFENLAIGDFSFGWGGSITFPIEPTGHLTTLWAKQKAF